MRFDKAEKSVNSFDIHVKDNRDSGTQEGYLGEWTSAKLCLTTISLELHLSSHSVIYCTCNI